MIAAVAVALALVAKAAAQDLCVDGITNPRGDVCCAAGCEVCGACLCSERGVPPLDGPDFCCPNTIIEAGFRCSLPTDVGCVLADVVDIPGLRGEGICDDEDEDEPGSPTPSGSPSMVPSNSPTPAIIEEICNRTTINTTVSVQVRDLDAIILLDESGSVGSVNFERTKTFASSTVRAFDEAVENGRVGVGAFNSGFRIIEPGTTDLVTLADVTIPSIVFRSGGTRFSESLNFCISQLVDNAMGSSDVSRFCILITDGIPSFSDQSASRTAASTLKANNVTLIGLHVGSTNGRSFLFELTSCDDFTFATRDDCLFYLEEDSFQNFEEEARQTAIDILIATETVVCEGD